MKVHIVLRLCAIFCLLGIGLCAIYLAWVRQSTPIGIVIPHHDMVASTRLAYLKSVAKKTQPETIVLISPDHFDRASQSIITTDRLWNTSQGALIPNSDLIETLHIHKDESPFLQEHGITSVLADIKANFTESTIVPILMSRSATYEEVSDFVIRLSDQCPNCLVIASVDFSHSLDTRLAALHDQISLRGLRTLDTEEVYTKAEVDSPESLAALMLWAHLHNAQKFNLFAHTNSGHLAGLTSGEITTHIMGGYSKGKPAEAESSVTFMIGGDTMLARGVATYQEKTNNAFAKLGERFFWGVDTSIINLEGVFSDETASTVETLEKPPRLLFPIDALSLLKKIRVKAVNIANNHSFDAGENGYHFHKEMLRKEGISFFGNKSKVNEELVYIAKGHNMQTVFIGVYTHEPFSSVTEKIRRYDTEGYKVVIYAHCGEEYASVHTSEQEVMAHDWIDAGADLIVGAHPHVVQDVGVYKNVPIIYSVGNFLFDQNQHEQTEIGAVVSGEFTDLGLRLFLIPIHTYLQTYILPSPTYEKYTEQWTKPWETYMTPAGDFYFPY